MPNKSGRILIASAAPDESKWLSSILAKDYQLCLANHGAEVLKRLDQPPLIDLLLLAGPLPDMSDAELLRTIREVHFARDLPLVMLTDSDSEEDVLVEAFLSGADNCFLRPVQEVALLARVEALLKLKHTIDQIRARIAELAEADLQRLRIFRMASHDLRSLLSNIRVAESILCRNLPQDRLEIKQSLDMIHLMADTMDNIITNYLDAMELRAGRLQLKVKPVNLRDVVLNVVSQFEFTANKKNIMLQVGSLKGWVFADADGLLQVLGNLVSNAIKYSPYESVVKVYTSSKNGLGTVTVEDQGPGIPPKERSGLFREFGRLSTHPTGGESKTGLGLWIVKELVEAQEGVVGAEFPKSGGSKFWIGLQKVAELSENREQVQPSLRSL